MTKIRALMKKHQGFFRIIRKGQNNKNKKRKFQWLIELLLLIILIFAVRTFIFGTVTVKGSSMEPNFHHGDFVMVNKLAYHIGTPQRGDIAICWLNSGNREEYIIKRVIGLPGDEIDFKIKEDGWDWEYELYINGKKQEESYVKEPNYQAGTVEYPFIVPENCYFVMGDNRNASTDSREASIGAIEKSHMKGKVFFRLYPFDSMTMVKNIEKGR